MRILILIILILSPLACTPCWDQATDSDIVQCMQSLPKENILRYPKVKSYLDQHKVYISLTTSPKRISQLPLVLSTLDLSYVEKIILL